MVCWFALDQVPSGVRGVIDHALPFLEVRDVLHGDDLHACRALNVDDDIADAPSLLRHRLLYVNVEDSGDRHLYERYVGRREGRGVTL
jgi:hypothetical protein